MQPLIKIAFLLGSLALFSCSATKTRTLSLENEKLRLKVDSLNKELKTKVLALSQAQKTINQLVAEKSKRGSSSRKKVDPSDQDNVAMFMQNITKYVEWQSEKKENYFVIGVVGDEGMFDKISNQFKGKTIAEKPVLVKLMKTNKDIEAANLFYISSSKIYLLDEVEKIAKKGSTLVMSDALQESDGIHINFFNENDTLRFDMNDAEIKKSRLTISSSLKSLLK